MKYTLLIVPILGVLLLIPPDHNKESKALIMSTVATCNKGNTVTIGVSTNMFVTSLIATCTFIKEE